MALRAADLAAGAALAVAVVFGAAAWLERPGRVDVPAGRQEPGIYAVGPRTLEAPIALPTGDVLEPVAGFEVRGRVLHIERFRPFRSLSNWVPGLRPATHDVGLGFGPMTDSANVELFTYFHDGATGGLRYLGWRARDARGNALGGQLARFVTNVHVIPADAAIERAIARVKIGELLTLRGELVNLRDGSGRLATTSVTPGDRDCEIVYVREVEVARL